jgi:hypothetical protein
VVVGLIALVFAVGLFVFNLRKDSDSAACGTPFAEQIDPGSSQHVLPDAPEPTYITNPPTSGAHKPGDYPTGVLAEPIDPAVQVAMLEAGEVLVQYRDVAGSALRRVESLAGDHLTVAPNETLDEPIVATAWLWKMTCSRVDTKALEDFASMHRLQGPGH